MKSCDCDLSTKFLDESLAPVSTGSKTIIVGDPGSGLYVRIENDGDEPAYQTTLKLETAAFLSLPSVPSKLPYCTKNEVRLVLVILHSLKDKY